MRMPPYIEALIRTVGVVDADNDSAACACRPILKHNLTGPLDFLLRGFGGMRMPPYIEAPVRLSARLRSSYSAACACRPTLNQLLTA